MRTRSRWPMRREGTVEKTLRNMKPPDDVTITLASSPSSARRGGSGRSTARSASMRLRLRALRRPTSSSTKRR
jgi:hypothetical protein